jgi:hypothetical protein
MTPGSDSADPGYARSTPALSIGGRWRRGPLVVLTAVLAVAALLTAVRAPARAAGPTDVTWTPGDVSWGLTQDGRCLTTQSAIVHTGSAEDATALSTALRNLPRKTDFPAATGIQDIHANVGYTSGSVTKFGAALHAYLPGDKCGKEEKAQQALFGAVVTAAVYVAVSTLSTAATASLGVEVASSSAAQAAAGCVGGTVAATVSSRLTGGAPTNWKERLSTAVSGCLTDGTSGGLPPTAELGKEIGYALRTRLTAAEGISAAAAVAVVGESAATAAGEAGLDMVIPVEVVEAASEAASAAA